MGYSQWGRRELDMTERLNTAHLLTIRDSTTVIKQGENRDTCLEKAYHRIMEYFISFRYTDVEKL